MSTNTAESYAEEFAAIVRARTDRGAAFGLVNDDTDEWSDDDAAYLSFKVDEGTPWREASPTDYLSDVLDVQYLINADRTYRHARVLIGVGGPNVWIDTRAGVVEVSWWSAPVTRELPAEFIDGLDEALLDLWEQGA